MRKSLTLLILSIYFLIGCGKDLNITNTKRKNILQNINKLETQDDYIEYNIQAKIFPRNLKYVKEYEDVSNEKVEEDNTKLYNDTKQRLDDLIAAINKNTNGVLRGSYTIEFNHAIITEDDYAGVLNNSSYRLCEVDNGTGVENRKCEENANSGSWSYSNSYSECQPTYCDEGYELINGVCKKSNCTGSSYKTCRGSNGGGIKTRSCVNHKWEDWSTCQLTACDRNYHLEDNLCVKTSCTSKMIYLNNSSEFLSEQFEISTSSDDAKTRIGMSFLKWDNKDNYEVDRFHTANWTFYTKPTKLITFPNASTLGAVRHEFAHALDWLFNDAGEAGMASPHDFSDSLTCLNSAESNADGISGERQSDIRYENLFSNEVEKNQCTNEVLNYCKLRGFFGDFSHVLNCSSNSDSILSPRRGRPQKVGNVTISTVNCSKNELNISWDIVSFADHYKIFRDDILIEESFKTDYSNEIVNYTDPSPIIDNKIHSYDIFACNSYGCSDPQSEKALPSNCAGILYGMNYKSKKLNGDSIIIQKNSDDTIKIKVYAFDVLNNNITTQDITIVAKSNNTEIIKIIGENSKTTNKKGMASFKIKGLKKGDTTITFKAKQSDLIVEDQLTVSVK